MKAILQHFDVLADIESEFVFFNPLAATGEIHEGIIGCFNVYFNHLHKRGHFLLSFIVLIGFSVCNLERDSTSSVKRDSQDLAFASNVRLLNLGLLLLAELGDLQKGFSRCQVAVDYHAKKFYQASLALVPRLSSSDLLHDYYRVAILLKLVYQL